MLYVLYYVLYVAVIKNVSFIHERLYSCLHISTEYIVNQCVMKDLYIAHPIFTHRLYEKLSLIE